MQSVIVRGAITDNNVLARLVNISQSKSSQSMSKLGEALKCFSTLAKSRGVSFSYDSATVKEIAIDERQDSKEHAAWLVLSPVSVIGLVTGDPAASGASMGGWRQARTAKCRQSDDAFRNGGAAGGIGRLVPGSAGLSQRLSLRSPAG